MAEAGRETEWETQTVESHLQQNKRLQHTTRSCTFDLRRGTSHSHRTLGTVPQAHGPAEPQAERDRPSALSPLWALVLCTDGLVDGGYYAALRPAVSYV